MPETVDLPKTLDASGAVPASRMNSAEVTQNRVTKLMDNDNKGRAKRRAMAKGLVDGNPPYSQQALRNAGRADACNVNWRQAEAFLSQAASAFYDVFNEAETYATVNLKADNPGVEEKKSKIVTEEFDRMIKEDEGFDNTMQVSQESMVLYGRGPLMFPDLVDWRPKNVQDKDCLVPDRALSNVSMWDELCVLDEMTPDQLYKKIQDEDIARQAGWNVDAVKKSIIHAASTTEDVQEQRAWEYFQEKLKTQSQAFNDDAMVIKVAHYYVREFATDEHPEGAISHTVVTHPSGNASETKHNEFLFKKINRFESWRQIIHPMYYDALGGGKHYAVTGLGQKMFSALEFQNRLLCNQADKAFFPTTMLRASNESNTDTLKIAKMGPFAVVPKNAEVVPTGIRGDIQEGVGFSNFLNGVLNNNLSGYRTSTPQKSGNPVTAEEFKIRASEQAQLGGTQISRYYNQEDWLYTEMYKRSIEVTSKSVPGGKAAMAFIKRCEDRGVTRKDLKNIKSVNATRIVGKGSQAVRQQAMSSVAIWAPMLPPEGQTNLIRDSISSQVGVKLVDRYFPGNFIPEKSDQHNVLATLQVASMKQGVPAVVTTEQNHETFATVFIKAGADALQTAQSGGNPQEILGFLELAMPAAMQHIQMLEKDQNKKAAAEKLTEQWNKIAEMANQLRKFAGATPEQQQQAEDMSFDQKLKAQEAQANKEREDFKVQESNKRSDQKIKQQMANKDATTAHNIILATREQQIKAAQEQNGSTDKK